MIVLRGLSLSGVMALARSQGYTSCRWAVRRVAADAVKPYLLMKNDWYLKHLTILITLTLQLKELCVR